MSRRSIVGIFLLLAAFAPAFSGTRSLSLDEAIEIAVKQNKNLQIAKLGVQKAEAQVREAIGNALPSLNLSAGYNYNIQLPVFFFPDPATGSVTPVRFGLTNAYTVNAQLQQVLFNSAVFTGIGASKIYEHAAEAQLNAVVAEVVSETKRLYYQALAAKAFVEVADATMKNAEETQKSITALFNEGLVAEFDKIRSDVAVLNLQPTVADARSAQYNALAALQTFLVVDLTDTLAISANGFPAPSDVPSEDSVMVKALRSNYELKSLALQVDVSKEFIDIYRSDYFPTLAAFGQWQNLGQSESLSNWTTASSTAVGLNFSVNLFNGFRTNAKVEQAKVDWLSNKQRYDQVENLIRLQVRTIVNQMRAAKLRIDAQKSTVGQAQRGFDIARIRYTEGTGSILEINDAETALARARVNEISALLDYYVTRATLDRVTGDVEERFLRLAR